MKIGAKIRRIRQAQRLTVQQLATKVGITRGAVSQIERGVSNPSIGTLKALADTLGITMGSLFDTTPAVESLVVHRTQRKVLSPKPGITYYLLTPDLSGRVEFIVSEYAPGATTGSMRYTHSGEECGLVLQGRLRLQVGDATYDLTRGDSIRFDCSIPHRLTNRGTSVLRCIWAICPPSF